MSRLLPWAGSALLVTGIVAQQPIYRMGAAARPGSSVGSLVLDAPSLPFLTLVDLRGGPMSFAGQTLYLGLSPALTTMDVGVLDAIGRRSLRIAVPAVPALVGTVWFGQSFVIDRSSPNGAFRASNGESLAIHGGRRAIVERFDDAVRSGLRGDYDQSVRGRLQARAPSTRLARIVDGRRGVLFGSPIASPLDRRGQRTQMVVRAVDIGAKGVEELVTGIQWRPFGKVVDDSYPRLAIHVSHSKVVPDFSVDPRSALPRFPASGLKRTFAQNVAAGERPVRLYDGKYAIKAADLRSDGYLPYPIATPFAYNGTESLLLDFQVAPAPRAKGANGQVVYLKVVSSARPDARVLAVTSQPFRAKQAQTGDNIMHDYQLELTKVQSDALSRWIDSGSANPDYDKAIIATQAPAGTQVSVEFRGQQDSLGNGRTRWSADANVADGRRFLQYRVVFRAAPSGATPSIDTLVVPIR